MKRKKSKEISVVKLAKKKTKRSKAIMSNDLTFSITFRLWCVRLIIIAMFVFLVGRIAYIWQKHGDDYSRRVIRQLIASGTQSDSVIMPNRGSVMDRNHQPLAVSVTYYDVFLDVKMLLTRSGLIGEPPKNSKGEIVDLSYIVDETFNAVHEVLGTPLDKLYAYLEKDENGKYVYEKYQHLIFETHIKNREMQALNDKKEELMMENINFMRDIYTEAVSERSYVYGTIAPQVIGFMRGDSAYGLENTYNEYLVGEPGRIFQTYSNDGVSTTKIDAVEGYSLITTLDFQLQQFSEQLCLKYAAQYNAPNVSVIIMNPYGGEIYAMAEAPGFDLNDPINSELITNPIVGTRIKSELESGDASAMNSVYKLWNNFNVTSTLEPGSIFKPITVAAALEEGIIGKDESFYCGGYKEVIGYRIRCHKLNGHGAQTLEEAIMNSCNVALMDIAERMGRDIFYKYQHDFGYGEKTGIDLPAEESCSALLHSLVNLNESELATGSFGQRFKCTPIQAITSFAAVINGGIVYQPYIVSQMADKKGNVVYENAPKVVRKVITEETSGYLRTVMQRVISEEGTGRRAAIEGYAIGGKTGTGEQGIRDTENYSHSVDFIGYLPVEKPQYLVLALVHEVPDDSYVDGVTSAAPMIKEIFQYLIDNKSIAPISSELVAENSDKTTMPNFVGMTVYEAAKLLNSKQMDYELSGGSGSIISSQTPDAGTTVPKNAVVWLTIKPEGDYALVSVPNVVGFDVASAEQILREAGFEPLIVYDEPKAASESIINEAISVPDDFEFSPDKIVYKQMPGAGISVIEGIEVKLRVR